MTEDEALDLRREMAKLRERAFAIAAELSRKTSMTASSEGDLAAASRLQSVANDLGEVEELLSLRARDALHADVA